MYISVSQIRVPTTADTRYACARVGFVNRNDANDLYAKATAAGFQHVGGNQYTHDDGSWLMLDARGLVQRGVGGVQFQGIPGGQRAQQAAAAAAQPAPQAPVSSGAVAIDRSRPPVPASMIGYGIQRIGIVNAQTAPGNCLRNGFTQNGSTFVHPDGSWVVVTGGRVQVGWKGYCLAELPYQRGWL